jgi:hypothetical protein
MIFKGIIAPYSENHKKHKTTLCVHNINFSFNAAFNLLTSAFQGAKRDDFGNCSCSNARYDGQHMATAELQYVCVPSNWLVVPGVTAAAVTPGTTDSIWQRPSYDMYVCLAIG